MCFWLAAAVSSWPADPRVQRQESFASHRQGSLLMVSRLHAPRADMQVTPCAQCYLPQDQIDVRQAGNHWHSSHKVQVSLWPCLE